MAVWHKTGSPQTPVRASGGREGGGEEEMEERTIVWRETEEEGDGWREGGIKEMLTLNWWRDR